MSVEPMFAKERQYPEYIGLSLSPLSAVPVWVLAIEIWEVMLAEVREVTAMYVLTPKADVDEYVDPRW